MQIGSFVKINKNVLVEMIRLMNASVVVGNFYLSVRVFDEGFGNKGDTAIALLLLENLFDVIKKDSVTIHKKVK